MVLSLTYFDNPAFHINIILGAFVYLLIPSNYLKNSHFLNLLGIVGMIITYKFNQELNSIEAVVLCGIGNTIWVAFQNFPIKFLRCCEIFPLVKKLGIIKF